MSILSVVAITAEGDFLALRDAWNALLENTRAPSVFLYHEWFEAAWAWRKKDSTLFVLCAYEDRRLVGVLPLVFVREKKKLYKERRLEFLTVPDTQSCDVVAADIDRSRVAQALAGEMERRCSQWDRLHFAYLPDASIVGRELCREFELRGFLSRFDDMGRNPSIALNGTWPDYYSSRSRRLKKANNLIANRMKKAGEVRVDWFEPGNADARGTNAALDIAIGISGRSWKRETGNSLDNPGPLAFIRMLSTHANRRGWLSLWILSLDGEPMAMEYQLVFNGYVHALRADVVDGCVELSPGSYLSRHLLEKLFGRGLVKYCMGPGGNAYKSHWISEGEDLRRMVVYGRTFRGTFAKLWDVTFRPRLRAVREKWLSLRRVPAADQKSPPEDGG